MESPHGFVTAHRRHEPCAILGAPASLPADSEWRRYTPAGMPALPVLVHGERLERRAELRYVRAANDLPDAKP